MSEQRNADAGPAVAPGRVPADPTYTPAHMRPQNAPLQAQPMHGQPELVVHEGSGVDAEQRGRGVRDIVGGLVLIGIGFTWGSSVFLGNPTGLDWFFDGLGTFWVCKGLYNLFTA
ncbi:MAG: hypothetical protein ACYTHK_14025 [Planctomycetota bacterium]|jgi:hypothetical protein